MVNWQPGASLEALQKRASLLTQIRNFFAEKNVMEVETPALASAPATDLHIQSLFTEIDFGNGQQRLYLQTSPEFAMKRLLAAHKKSIFQVGKAFRHDPITAQHNPEFTMLEWYQPGYTLHQLMDEVAELFSLLFKCTEIPRFTYRELFEKFLEINPHQASTDELSTLVHKTIEYSGEKLDQSDCLHLLMSEKIEPNLPQLCFIYDYPQVQASLSVTEKNEEGDEVAKRFEVYGQGIELANGYFELVDAREQKQRFEQDNLARKRIGLEEYPVDEKLIAALEHGMPSCSGVAVGIDRLLMAMHKISHIDEVISFTTPRA